ncbi:hypothetical protein, partial [Flavobacterium oreochromis]
MKDDTLTNTFKKDTMEYFDIKKYKENKTVNGYIFNLNDGTQVMQIEHEDQTYTDERRQKNSPYTYFKTYHKNGVIKSIGKSFYVFNIDTYREYDEKGKLIEEINFEKPYKFSSDELRKKIKEEYDIDIVSDYTDSDQTKIKVNRWLGYKEDWNIYKKNVPMYQVAFINKKGEYVVLEINANNGETIFERINGKVIKPTENDTNKNSSSIYKTHQGKSYTKTEWEDFEEKQYE